MQLIFLRRKFSEISYSLDARKNVGTNEDDYLKFWTGLSAAQEA